MDLAPKPYYWPSLEFGASPPLATRSGWMALACMPLVFATASKASWITLLTGVSHERLQVFHRWTAYAFFVLALMHTFPFIVYHIRFHDMVEQVTESSTLFYWTGIVAIILQAWLTFASHSTIRCARPGRTVLSRPRLVERNADRSTHATQEPRLRVLQSDSLHRRRCLRRGLLLAL